MSKKNKVEIVGGPFCGSKMDLPEGSGDGDVLEIDFGELCCGYEVAMEGGLLKKAPVAIFMGFADENFV